MTSFKGESAMDTQENASAPPPETEQPDTKATEKPKELVSRLKASPELWGEAMQFAKMLTYCRPNLSRTENRFINDYLRPIGVRFDKKGNLYKQIGDAPVLWSCHIDTVHAKKGFQKIEYWIDGTSGDTFLGVGSGDKSSCLGADDTAGIWLMLEMIRKNVPGLYIFHRGEECGGIGSKWIAKNNVEVLKNIRFAIAFDRKDTSSIITFQGGTRCCSDEFAKSLAEQLKMDHRCDETGSFTDTASYVDHIAECTNVSVGYYNAHCSTEKINLDYLFRLRDALCQIDVEKLVEKRKPGENTRRWGGHTYHHNSTKHNYYDDYNEWDFSNSWWSRTKKERPEGALEFDDLKKLYPGPGCGWLGEYYYNSQSGFWLPCKADAKKLPKTNAKKDLGVTKLAPSVSNDTENHYGSYNEAVRLIRHNPDIIADLLESQGYGSLEIRDHVKNSGGVLFY